MQLQNIIKITKKANTQFTEIKITILQVSNTYKIQTAEDISEDLENIIQGDMENQVHYI